MINRKSKKQSGFTLVELLVAVSLFVVVVTISMGAILSVFDANKKAQASKTIVDNLNLSIENMARTIRFGDNYYCGTSLDLGATNDCSTGSDSVSVTFNGNRVVYRLSGTSIEVRNSSGVYEKITSPETVIQYVRFYVFGSSNSDLSQPYVVAVIKGYSGSKPSVQTNFSIETFMSKRNIDSNL